MVQDRHYSKAPITEAIIDIRVQHRPETSLAEMERVRVGEESTYPKQQQTNLAIGQFEVGLRVSASASSHPTGFRFANSDDKLIWQSRLDGFTLSRLAPYESWIPFRDEARRLWTRYREVSQPTDVQRLAVRYINRFDIPGQSVDLKQYFRTSPEVSPELPQGMAGFFLQVALPLDDINGQVLINQAIIPPPDQSVVSIILDIDLMRHLEVPQEEDAIWKTFELLHVRKNEIFEACITDEARRLIQ